MTRLTFTAPPAPFPLFGVADVEVPSHCTVEEYAEALVMLGCVVTREDGELLDDGVQVTPRGVSLNSTTTKGRSSCISGARTASSSPPASRPRRGRRGTGR